jgi:hypothetical protein
MLNEFSIFFKNPKPKLQRVETELLSKCDCVNAVIVSNLLVPNKNCASRSSGKLGELFHVQEDGSKLRLAALATLTMADAQKFFAGWITSFGTPPFIFVFPLSEIEQPNL